MLKLQCGSCSYSFTVKSEEKIPKRCPYCAENSTVQRVKQAQEIIDEVSRASEQFLSR